jgi:integrase
LTVDEVAAVRAALSPDGYVGQAQRQRAEAQAVLILLTQTGMRWGELCALRVADVRDGEVHVWASKTERARVVPLTAVAATHLALLTTTGHSLVLGGRRGCAALSRAIDRVCNTTDAVSRMGRATIHSLRHTYASRLRQGGAGLDEVQDMLGHANISMTRRYAHLGKRETQDRMRNILEQST